jgi:hypothetical protein
MGKNSKPCAACYAGCKHLFGVGVTGLPQMVRRPEDCTNTDCLCHVESRIKHELGRQVVERTYIRNGYSYKKVLEV